MLAQCTPDVAGDLVDTAPVWPVLAPVLRFSEMNPLTGRAYADSRFGELPEYAACVVSDVLGMGSGEWDGLVRAGEAYSATGYWLRYSIGSWLGEEVQRRQGGVAPDDRCGDCWGTGADFDSDGSLTGTVGAPVLCSCIVFDRRLPWVSEPWAW